MEKLFKLILCLMIVLITKTVSAQEVKDLSKNYDIISVSYSVLDNDETRFPGVTFRFGWNKKVPYVIAVQFVNHGYDTQKFKFAIKDITMNKLVVLGTVHKSTSGYETLKPNSQGVVWSGPVDNVKDSFSLHVWDAGGNEFDKAPISVKDQQ
jgi:hypothetical protein